MHACMYVCMHVCMYMKEYWDSEIDTQAPRYARDEGLMEVVVVCVHAYVCMYALINGPHEGA